MTAFKPDRFGAEEFSDQPISVCGKAFRAHMSGALYWPAEDALIVSDMHLEKGSSFAARGQMLPPYDTRETLRKLADAIDYYEAATVIALGDSFHDTGAAGRFDNQDLDAIKILQEGREWIWITGNHDAKIAKQFGGDVLSELTASGMRFCHEPGTGAQTHEIAGHLHPAARLVIYGTSIRRPCFIGNGRRLVMPAFGAFTGGLNILDAAYTTLFGFDGLKVWMLGQEGLYPVATRLLRED